MNIVNKSYLQVRNYLSQFTGWTGKFEEIETTQKDTGKRYSDQINKQRVFAFEAGQDELKRAIRTAEDPFFPNRYLLLEIYKEVLRDLHLRSQIRSAILKVVSNSFVVVDDNDKINDDLSKLIEKQWFVKAMTYELEAEFEGHSLIEIQKLIERNGQIEISDVKLFPREHVIPERGEIKLNVNDQKGLNYRDDPEVGAWFMEAGDPFDLGLLHIAAKYSIYKKYALSDWSISMERFGDPIIAIGSSSLDQKEIKKKEEWAKNFGKNGYYMGDVDDEVNLLERKNGNGYEIYEKNILMQDKENSKGVNGQVGTADENAYVGTAEVQERMMGDYTKARMRNLTFWLNDTLLPKLINLNGGNTAYAAMEGYEIKPLYLFEEDEKEEDADTINSPTPGNPEARLKNKKPGGASPVGKSFKGLRL
jgi:hypothetical protein